MASAPATEWDDRKDRSIRLWGPNGQRRMERANALVLGASATACETLKNLVLPGLGHYTIVDDRNVSQSTFEANFYVERKDLGQPLAACIVRQLSEMNTDPTGSAIQVSPVEFVREVIRDRSKLQGFTIVILSCATSDVETSNFGAICHEIGIPIIIVKSAGLLGYVRSSFKEACILEPKDSDQTSMKEDYWLTEFEHFPELQTFVNSFDFNNPAHLGDVPPFVLLHHCYRKMRDAGTLPPRGTRLTFQHIEPFYKELQAIWTTHQNTDTMPGNIKELSKGGQPEILMDIKLVLPQITPPAFARLISDPRGAPEAMTKDTSSFWLLVCALREFAAAHNGRPPLSGRVPDQPTISAHFVALLQLYRSKRDSHVAWLLDAANRHAARCGARQVSHEEAKDMTEFACFATVFTGTSLEQEFSAAFKVPYHILDADYSTKPHPLAVYPVFRAWFRCEALGSQAAGSAPDLKAAVSTVCGDLGVPVEQLAPGYVEEIQRSWDHARGGPVEITTVASVIGGIAANEAVKHIVQKFQPLNNSAIYDGANLEFCVDFKM